MADKKTAPDVASHVRGQGYETNEQRHPLPGDASIIEADGNAVQPMSDRLAAALRYASLGWRVFPIVAKGKRPAGLLVPNGLKDATTDADTIRKWWRDYPQANIGGTPPEGTYVLDLDTYRLGANLDALAARLAALHTPMQRSGGGGLHFVLRGPAPSQAALRKRWGYGIDVKASGKGYAMLAPSVHPETGALYEWGKAPDIAPADAPAWLLEGTAPVPVEDDGQQRKGFSETLPAPLSHHKPVDLDAARALLDKLPHWRDDYDVWLRVGMALHHEFGGHADGLALWDEWSQASPKYTPDDPKRSPAAKWATFGKYPGDPVTLGSLVEAANEPRAEHLRPQGPLFLLRASDLMKRSKRTAYDTVLGAALPLGVVIFSGEGGTGKSTLLATFAACITNGKPCPPWELPTTTREPGAVLWLTTEEDRERIVFPRHEKLGGNCDLLFVPAIRTEKHPDGTPYAVDFDIERDLQPLMEQADAAGTPIRLVVCDALPALVQWGKRNPSSDPDVKKLIERLAGTVTAFGASLAGVVHWNKKVDLDDAYRTSGAQAWRDSPRLSFVVKKGWVYTNKTNDQEEVGTSFVPEVVAVLYEVPAQLEGRNAMRVTARRAVFGPALLDKAKLLALVKGPQPGDDDTTSHEAGPSRLDKMVELGRDVLAIYEGTDVPAGVFWGEIERDMRTTTNGTERRKVRERLGLDAARDNNGKHVLRRIPSADIERE